MKQHLMTCPACGFHEEGDHLFCGLDCNMLECPECGEEYHETDSRLLNPIKLESKGR